MTESEYDQETPEQTGEQHRTVTRTSTATAALSSGRPTWQKVMAVIVLIMAVTCVLFVMLGPTASQPPMEDMSAGQPGADSAKQGAPDSRPAQNRQPDASRRMARSSTASLSPELARRFAQSGNRGATQSATELSSTAPGQAATGAELDEPNMDPSNDPIAPDPSLLDDADVSGRSMRGVSTDEIESAVNEAIDSTQTSKRVIRIEEKVMGMSDRMRSMEKTLDTLVGLAQKNLEATQKETARDVLAAAKTLADEHEPDSASNDAGSSPTDAKGGTGSHGRDAQDTKPDAVSPRSVENVSSRSDSVVRTRDIASASSGIRDIEISSLGPRKARVTFRLNDGATPRTRVIKSTDVSWTSSTRWALIDIYGPSLSSDLPRPTGIISDVDYGAHQGFRRFVFHAGSRINDATVNAADGAISLTITASGDTTASKTADRTRSYGDSTDSSTTARRPSAERKQVAPKTRDRASWVVRAINDNAAVIYDLYSNSLLSLKRGSRVPKFGVVTNFSAPKRTVYTTRGRITLDGATFD